MERDTVASRLPGAVGPTVNALLRLKRFDPAPRLVQRQCSGQHDGGDADHIDIVHLPATSAASTANYHSDTMLCSPNWKVPDMSCELIDNMAALFDRLRRGPRLVVIELHGPLTAREVALNIKSVGPVIDSAFRAARRPGSHVILDIDSPGGSPVHSYLIATRIRRRADERKIPVTAVVQEVGASGGYWLACAGDTIRAGTLSIVGSIGVVGGGFGFPGLLARVGVERRLYTAGARKARLDPFEPESAEDVAFTRRLMEDIHTQFKDWVRMCRGARLARAEDELFDGRVYLGGEALSAGLVDAIGELDTLIRELGGARARPRTFRPIRRRGWLACLPRMFAGDIVDAAIEQLDHAVTRPHLRL